MLGTRSRLYNSTGFFFLTWAAHYIPFFIMGRQLFLHHYLPAHLASALVAGALIEFIFNLEPADVTNSTKEGGKIATKEPGNKPIRERMAGQSLLATWAASGVVVAAWIWGFLFFAPLTYGTPGLSVPEVQSRKWLNYDLHFAK
jgi:dolichyl-phosphate-mannose-protein mannosyltransferase